MSVMDVPTLPLVWGAEAIGKALGIKRRAAFHLLAQGRVPGARLIGGRWALDVELCRAEFRNMPAAPAADEAVEGQARRRGRPRKVDAPLPPIAAR